MEYLSAKQTAQKWDTHIRVIQTYCVEGRIPGAQKLGHSWIIPADANKPLDPRKARRQPLHAMPSIEFLGELDLPKSNPDAAVADLDPRLQSIVRADLAFRRGDPAPAKACWHAASQNAETVLSAASLAIAAAVSDGDYALYHEIRHNMMHRQEATGNGRERALLSLPDVLVTVSMAAPEITPEWLKNADFSLFPLALRPYLSYLHILHLLNIGEYSAMLASASTALLLHEREDTFTWLDIYLGVLCAVASDALGQHDNSRQYLDAALKLAMPHGMIAPFADHLGNLSGTLEQLLAKSYPDYTKAVITLWKHTRKNYIDLHNTFTKEHITTILTPQEYHVARLLSGGATYAEAGQRLYLSVGRVKNITSDIYAKLHISKRRELRAFIL